MEEKEALLWNRISELMTECSTKDRLIKALIITVLLLVIFTFIGSLGWYSTKRDSADSREGIMEIKKILLEKNLTRL